MNARDSDACFHCDSVLPDGADRSDRANPRIRRFCCAGCAQAAAWIENSGFGDYYRMRTAPAQRVQGNRDDFDLWDRDDLLHEHIHMIGEDREITLLVSGMRCAACAWLLDRSLRAQPGVVDCAVNALTGRVRVRWSPATTALSGLLSAISALGYAPSLAHGEAGERLRRQEKRSALLRLGVAGLGAMQAMMFSEALYLDTAGTMPLATRDFLRWITLLVSLPVVFYSGWPFIEGMLRELRARLPGMDTLIGGATLLAFGASVFETVRGGPEVWFDAAVMFVFLLLLARTLELRARRMAGAHADLLARASPAVAERERTDGTSESVPLAALEIGDIVRVAAGAVVPADGVLLDREARFEESIVSGESDPVCKQNGAPVIAGSCALSSPARIRVSAVGSATQLAQLARLLAAAQEHRPRIARLANRIALMFVPALLAAAAITALCWSLYQPERALEVTLAMLVVSCPCALTLAIPTALTAAQGALAQRGVLALGPDAIENMAGITDIVFDKTGTLTTRAPELADLSTFEGMEPADALRVAATLEHGSGHPLAAVFRTEGPTLRTSELRAEPGSGLEGWIDGRRWRLGTRAFATGLETGNDDAIWLACEGRIRACFTVRERVRPDAPAVLESLRGFGLRIHLLSGDNASSVAGVASALGIEHSLSRQTPAAKLEYLRALQAHGRRIAMVGDGLNDVPVLGGADVAVGLETGAALTHRAADVLLVRDSLAALPEALALARRTRRVVRQNLIWAAGYNLIALPLAAMGLVAPWMAALGMAGSSLAVTLNALRLRRRERSRHELAAHAPTPTAALLPLQAS